MNFIPKFIFNYLFYSLDINLLFIFIVPKSFLLKINKPYSQDTLKLEALKKSVVAGPITLMEYFIWISLKNPQWATQKYFTASYIIPAKEIIQHNNAD